MNHKKKAKNRSSKKQLQGDCERGDRNLELLCESSSSSSSQRDDELFKASRMGLLSKRCKIKPHKRLLDWSFFLLAFLMIAVSFFWAYTWHALLSAGVFNLHQGDDALDVTFLWTFISIIISIGISRWLWDSVQTYYDRIETYVKTMNQIRIFVIEIESNYNYEKLAAAEALVVNTSAINRNDGSPIANEMLREILELKKLLTLFTRVSQYVFLDDAIRMSSPTKMDLEEELGDENKVGTTANNTLLGFHFNNRDPINVCFVLVLEIQKIVTDWINSKSVKRINDPITFVENIKELLEQIEVSKTIQSFKIYKYVVIAIIMINLAVLPIMIWPKLGAATVIFFPLVSVTFLAMPCVLLWLGDPFEGNVETNAFDRDYTERYVLNLIDTAFDPERLMNSRVSGAKQRQRMEQTWSGSVQF